MKAVEEAVPDHDPLLLPPLLPCWHLEVLDKPGNQRWGKSDSSGTKAAEQVARGEHSCPQYFRIAHLLQEVRSEGLGGFDE